MVLGNALWKELYYFYLFIILLKMNLFIIKNNNFKQLKAILDGMINGENEGKLKITITTKVKFKNLTKLNMLAKFS